MADVKWIKIVSDIFDDEKILLIEQMPESESLIVIWFKLLCLAGKQNNSGVFMINERIAYTDEMLAAIFRRKVDVVRMAIKVYEQFGMIEIIDGVITIPNWGKYQNFDKIDLKNEYMRNYMQTYRQKQIKKTCKANSKANSKANVSSADIDLEEDLDIYKRDILSVADAAEPPTPSDFQAKEEICRKEKGCDARVSEVITYLNKQANKTFRTDTPKTQSLITALLRHKYTVEQIKAVIDKQCDKWLYDAKMSEYLRPKTLFDLTNFESYLNATEVQQKSIEASKPTARQEQQSKEDKEMLKQHLLKQDKQWLSLDKQKRALTIAIVNGEDRQAELDSVIKAMAQREAELCK